LFSFAAQGRPADVADDSDVVYQPQRFPIMYPGSAQFIGSDGQPSGARGAVAHVEITINNRPHEITGFRIANQYLVPNELRNSNGLDWLRWIDPQQDVRTDLAQQNVIVRPAQQDLIVGRDGIHWHPWECPYPFRGGNNIVLDVVRQIPYSATQLSPQIDINEITCKVVVVGWAYVTDEFPPAGPPSTGFPVSTGARRAGV